MAMYNNFLYAASLLVILQSSCSSSDIHLTGTIGEDLDISCPVATRLATSVRWVDYIHNSGRDPALIFDSVGNPSLALDSSHPFSDNYLVTADHKLQILALTSDDYGTYECQVTNSDGNVIKKKIEVSVIELPQCPPTVRGNAGEEVDIMCSMEYGSNSMPIMDWFDSELNAIQSTDMAEIMNFQKQLTMPLTIAMDKKTYSCKAGLDSSLHMCETRFDVQYAVQNLRITKQAEYRVNEEITCSASGNPAPEVTWFHNGIKLTTELHQNVLIVEEDWMKSSNVVKCTAQNDGSETLTDEITFQALDENGKTWEAAPTTTAGDSTGEQTKVQSTSSTAVIGAVVAVIVVILIIAIIVILIRRKNNNKSTKGAKPMPIPQKDPDQRNGDIAEKA